MGQYFTDEPAASDAEALANLIVVFERLRLSPVLRMGQQLIDTQSEEDLLQTTMLVILEKEKWKEIRSRKALFFYTRRAMINGLMTLHKRAKKGESLDGESFDLAALEAQLYGWLEKSPAETFEIDREDEAFIEWMKLEFPVPKIHRLLDQIVDGCKKGKLPGEMRMTGREVTEMLRTIKRRRRVRERFADRLKRLAKKDEDDLIH
jgi:hypothetical protein